MPPEAQNQGNQPPQQPPAEPPQIAEIVEELRKAQLAADVNVDKYLKSVDSVLSRNIAPVLNLGLVIDAYPFANVYRVANGAGGVHVCRLLGHTSTFLIGATDARTIPPGTLVWYFTIPGSTFGVIIGTDPTFGTGNNALNDIIFQGSSVGFFFNSSLRQPVQNRSLGFADFSGRNPEDSLVGGELCYSTETGGLLLLDSFMGCLRTSEICGIWLFYLDALLRIFGNNLQIWSGISQEEFYNDEGESYHYFGLAFYPKEQLGILRPDQTIFEEHQIGPVRNQPGYSRIMPKNRQVKPFHRIRTYSGYIAGGQRELVYVPTDNEDIKLHDPQQHNPEVLLDIVKGIDGQFGVRAVKSIHLVKTPVIHWPERLKRLEDTKGDRPPAYTPSKGDHELINGIAISYTASLDPTRGPGAEAIATVPETSFAKLFRWLGESGFYYHKKDFKLIAPRMRVISRRHAKYTGSPDGNPDDGVPPQQIYISRPEGNFYYYDTTASISINEDSSISLVDGWNSSIRMANDRIYLDARTIVLNCENIVMPCPTIFPEDEAYITVREQYIDNYYLCNAGIKKVFRFEYLRDALSLSFDHMKSGVTVTVTERNVGSDE